MTISQTAEIIAEILHGISFGETAGVHWRWIEAHAASYAPRMMVSRI
jgi:hypothetical protein